MTNQTDTTAADREVDDNYKYFKKMQPEWKYGHISDYALIRHQKLVAFFENKRDAINTGIRDYGLGDFSVQSVRDEPVDFGHQSHVLF